MERDWSNFEREALVHLDALHRYACRLTRSRRKAEDLVQETMLRALRFFHQYRSGTNCKAWLFRIMRNCFINGWLSGKRQRRTSSLEETEEHYLYRHLDDPHRAVEESPEIRALAGELAPVVRMAVEELPEEFRTPLILCDVEGLPYQEIADIMGVPIGTIRSRLNRARRRLQRELGEYYAEVYGGSPAIEPQRARRDARLSLLPAGA